jgi:hypothetical protein
MEKGSAELVSNHTFPIIVRRVEPEQAEQRPNLPHRIFIARSFTENLKDLLRTGVKSRSIYIPCSAAVLARLSGSFPPPMLCAFQTAQKEDVLRWGELDAFLDNQSRYVLMSDNLHSLLSDLG